MAAPETGFAALQLKSSLLEALRHAKYQIPPIQAALIPHALEGRDVIGQAQTGTGKTGRVPPAFLNGWGEDAAPGPQAIGALPDPQSWPCKSIGSRKLGAHPDCRCVPIYGGAHPGTEASSARTCDRGTRSTKPPMSCSTKAEDAAECPPDIDVASLRRVRSTGIRRSCVFGGDRRPARRCAAASARCGCAVDRQAPASGLGANLRAPH